MAATTMAPATIPIGLKTTWTKVSVDRGVARIISTFR